MSAAAARMCQWEQRLHKSEGRDSSWLWQRAKRQTRAVHAIHQQHQATLCIPRTNIIVVTASRHSSRLGLHSSLHLHSGLHCRRHIQVGCGSLRQQRLLGLRRCLREREAPRRADSSNLKVAAALPDSLVLRHSAKHWQTTICTLLAMRAEARVPRAGGVGGVGHSYLSLARGRAVHVV